MTARQAKIGTNGALSEFEREVVALFVRVAGLVGLPRSIGELYGALYVSPKPLNMEELRQKLNLSKGATSQGLRLLREFGAVSIVRLPGDRRDHFVAEAQLRKLIGGFLRGRVQPHLENGVERIENLKRLVENAPDGDREFLAERVKRLANWRRGAERVLPLVMKLIRV